MNDSSRISEFAIDFEKSLEEKSSKAMKTESFNGMKINYLSLMITILETKILLTKYK